MTLWQRLTVHVEDNERVNFWLSALGVIIFFATLGAIATAVAGNATLSNIAWTCVYLIFVAFAILMFAKPLRDHYRERARQ